MELDGSGDGFGGGDGDGLGGGDGCGSGYGHSYIDGGGYSHDHGYGSGFGYGTGRVYGYGYGAGAGYGYSHGDGFGGGDGSGSGYGYSYGDDVGVGSGHGSGYGFSYGQGFGYGHGYGEYLSTFAPLINPVYVLDIPNAEHRRTWLEAIGHERLFDVLDQELVDQDKDHQGNERLLLKMPLEDAEGGTIQAIRLQCPTTGRIYHHLVPTHLMTCQAAHNWMFSTIDYQPLRES